MTLRYHIRESWRAALVGALVTAILPVLIQWGENYDFSESGWDRVTSGGWIWSVAAVGAWLVVVALWHVLCAPMGHAREVISAHEKHHAAEIERISMAATPRTVVNVEHQHNHNHYYFGEHPDVESTARQKVLSGEDAPGLIAFPIADSPDALLSGGQPQEHLPEPQVSDAEV